MVKAEYEPIRKDDVVTFFHVVFREIPTSIPEENTSMPYSELKPEPTRLQAERHIHYTGLVATISDESVRNFITNILGRLWGL
ncbi:hypothetical protein TNCV_3932951 [Trichonephila clavipes]|nr:hypothetical protein TNCV_3932951 [Trichonephila clavipes]